VADAGSARAGGHGGRRLLGALAVASALPCAALVWPGSVPQLVVVLALMAWLGIFFVALGATRAEAGRRRKVLGEPAAARRSASCG
jgi:hypothetical protein